MPKPKHLEALSAALQVRPPGDGKDDEPNSPVDARPALRLVPEVADESTTSDASQDDHPFLRDVLVPRLSSGAPLSTDEIVFLRSVAKSLYSLDL